MEFLHNGRKDSRGDVDLDNVEAALDELRSIADRISRLWYRTVTDLRVYYSRAWVMLG